MSAKSDVFNLALEEDVDMSVPPIAEAPVPQQPTQEPEPEADNNEVAFSLVSPPEGLDEEDAAQPAAAPPPPEGLDEDAAAPLAGVEAGAAAEPAAEAALPPFALAEALALEADAGDGASPPLPPPITVTVSKEGSRKIGLDVRHYTRTSLEVLRVKEGLIEDYNLQVQAGTVTGNVVEAGDVIQEVNGFSGTANQLLRKLAADTRIELLIQRGLPPKG